MELNRPFLVIQIPFNFLRSPLSSTVERAEERRKHSGNLLSGEHASERYHSSDSTHGVTT